MHARVDVTCPECGGSGWKIERRDRWEVAVPCPCTAKVSVERLLAACRIPPRYAACTLDNFELWDASSPSLGQAKRKTREFVDAYPAVTRGLLFMGQAGVGKTHLAVAALKELVTGKQVRGLFVNFLELVQELQLSFDGSGRSREEILRPVATAEVLVLDELGAGKLTAWVSDLMYYVVNARYMERRITLVTTNYSDFPKRQGEESLTDRITAPVRSRLFEMCDRIDMRAADDYRRRLAERRGAS
ncbi:MAG: ATP-binding protein [Thermoanaerobaculaceae bacterium]|jgi:DNA replication protein DnaC|nr:ATP-binding protein [Thermoanaerobaculaceae bacterium]